MYMLIIVDREVSVVIVISAIAHIPYHMIKT